MQSKRLLPGHHGGRPWHESRGGVDVAEGEAQGALANISADPVLQACALGDTVVGFADVEVVPLHDAMLSRCVEVPGPAPFVRVQQTQGVAVERRRCPAVVARCLASLHQDLPEHLGVHRAPGEREVRSPRGGVCGHNHGLDVLDGLFGVGASVDQRHLQLQVHRRVVGVLQDADAANVVEGRRAPREIAGVAGVAGLVAPHRLTPPLRRQIPIHQLVHAHGQVHPVGIHLAGLARAPGVGVAGLQAHESPGAEDKLRVHAAARVRAHADLTHAPAVGRGGRGEHLEPHGHVVPGLGVGGVQGAVSARHHPAPGRADAGVGGGDPRGRACAHGAGAAVGVRAHCLRVARAACAVVDVFHEQEIGVHSVDGDGPPAITSPNNTIGTVVQSHNIHARSLRPDRISQHPHPGRRRGTGHKHLEHKLPRSGPHKFPSFSPSTKSLNAHDIGHRRRVPGGQRIHPPELSVGNQPAVIIRAHHADNNAGKSPWVHQLEPRGSRDVTVDLRGVQYLPIPLAESGKRTVARGQHVAGEGVRQQCVQVVGGKSAKECARGPGAADGVKGVDLVVEPGTVHNASGYVRARWDHTAVILHHRVGLWQRRPPVPPRLHGGRPVRRLLCRRAGVIPDLVVGRIRVLRPVPPGGIPQGERIRIVRTPGCGCQPSGGEPADTHRCRRSLLVLFVGGERQVRGCKLG
mmetsp:Transcript_25195/g.64466  ORF Transcript_25195/g.64466 Transcript_25195/m.64466 type:complete len:691 (+) Transcript_25195:4753-6825(+)